MAQERGRNVTSASPSGHPGSTPRGPRARLLEALRGLTYEEQLQMVRPGGAPSTCAAGCGPRLDAAPVDRMAPVQAKLSWDRTSFAKRTGVGDSSKSLEWKQIGRALDDYHALDDDQQETDEALPSLANIRGHSIVWLDKHGDDSPRKQEKNARRREAVEDLAYRDVPHEIGVITSGLRGGTTGPRIGGGQVGQVHLVDLDGETRVFKDQETGYDRTASGAVESGIPLEHGSLLGNRSVATSRLDKLFKTGVIAKTEFGTRIDENGEEVRGISQELGLGNTPDLTKEVEGRGMTVIHRQMNFDNPELQRQLATLQLLDAITGQVDRHPGNYFVKFDGDQVRVTGIDNDFSFGQDRQTIDGTGKEYDHFKAFPMFVDEEVAENLRAISVEELRAELEPLLPPAEVKATIKRFQKVLDRLDEYELQGRLISRAQWGRATEQDDPASYFARIAQNRDPHPQARAIPYDPNQDPDERKRNEERYLELWLRCEEVFACDLDTLKGGTTTRFGALRPAQLGEAMRAAVEEVFAMFPSMREHPWWRLIQGRIEQLPSVDAPRLTTTRDSFIEETGTRDGDPYSEDWQILLQAIEIYEGLKEDQLLTRQGLQVLGQVQRLGYAWLDRPRDQRQRAKKAQRMAAVERLVNVEIPRIQRAILKQLGIHYTNMKDGHRIELREGSTIRARTRDENLDTELDVALNGGVFMEIGDSTRTEGTNRDVPGRSTDEKLHVPATEEDIAQRFELVSITCLEFGIANWKAVTLPALMNMKSGGQAIRTAVVNAGLCTAEEIEGKEIWEIRVLLHQEHRRARVIEFINEIRALSGEKPLDDNYPEWKLELQIALESFVKDFPTEQKGREITVYVKPGTIDPDDIQNEAVRWTEFVDLLQRRFVGSGLPPLPIASGDKRVAGAEIAGEDGLLGYFSYRNEQMVEDPALGMRGFPHWLGSLGHESHSGPHALVFDGVELKEGRRLSDLLGV